MVETEYRADRKINRLGQTYRWSTNVKSVSHRYEIWEALMEEGFPVTFRGEAYNQHNLLLSGYVSVFIAEGESRNVYNAFNLKDAHYWSKKGWPEATLENLKVSGADEGTKREVLAVAYDATAAKLNWRGKEHNDKQDLELAKKMWRFAAKLRKGESGFGLLSA